MRAWIAMGVLSVLCVASSTTAGALSGKMRVEHLKNGLTVVMVPTGKEGTVAYYSLVRTGSRDETDPQHTGFAHLFEHMMFRGTKRFPKAKYEAKIQELGLDNNAFTSFDLTCFTVAGSTTSLEQIIDIEADRFQNLEYSKEDYKTETGAVLGEYNMVSASPELPLEEALLATAFKKHTYGHTTMGYLEDVKRMPGYYDYSVAFHKRFYTPDNITIIVTGAFDPEAALRWIEQHYGQWKGKRAQAKVKAEPAQTEARRTHVSWKSDTSDRMIIGYKIPAFGTNVDSAALAVASRLAFGETSPLYRKLVLEERKVLSLGASAGLSSGVSRDPSLFTVEVTLAKGTKFAEIEAAVDEAVAQLASGQIEDARVSAVRSHVKASFALGLETPDDSAIALALFMSATADPQSVDKWLEVIGGVGPQDVQRVVREYLRPARRTVATLSSESSQGGAK